MQDNFPSFFLLGDRGVSRTKSNIYGLFCKKKLTAKST